MRSLLITSSNVILGLFPPFHRTNNGTNTACKITRKRTPVNTATKIALSLLSKDKEMKRRI
ncbi:hypothetical protein GYH30_041096 [Glycine max]|uniref:Uncharacterized protein n=1 Tax=Glycine soja TaxID=3848 RepID=A0A445GMY1_GLYSO|nr:hypothetical protein GYH30_041096 [Glycine max]RZB62598.1 hypothetical protein D0Y65_039735 [Glycine soja]